MIKLHEVCTQYNDINEVLSCEGTKYSVLDHDVDKLIGELIFSEGKDPLDVEATLQPLPINMVYQVVTNCTPTINIENPKPVPPKLILNAGQLVSSYFSKVD